MAKNFSKQILLFTALLLIVITFACAKKNPFYLISANPEVRKLEKNDHKTCLSLKLNVDDENFLNSKYYWQCRLAFARYRIAANEQNPLIDEKSTNFIDLAAKIRLKIAQTNENSLLKETKKLDDKHHKECLSRGFVFETDDQAKIDEYFFCRRALIEEYDDVAPFGRQELLKYKNKYYNLSFVVNQRIKENIDKEEKLSQNYPTCVKYNIYSKNFARCTKAQDASRTCFKEINQKIFKKEWERKIKCQKRAYTKYSDDLLELESDLFGDETSRHNKNSDFVNNNNLASLGVSERDFISKEELARLKEEKEKKDIKDASKINSKLELYNRYELSKLRRKYIYACQLESNDEIEAFAHELEDGCEKLKEFEILGE